MTHHFFFLNESSLIPFLFARLKRGRKVLVLGENFCWPLLGWMLHRVCAGLRRAGLIVDAFDEIKEIRRFKEIFAYSDRTEIFARVEEASRRRYGFDVWEDRTPQYAMALKHAACNFIRHHSLFPFILHELDQHFPSESLIIHGV